MEEIAIRAVTPRPARVGGTGGSAGVGPKGAIGYRPEQGEFAVVRRPELRSAVHARRHRARREQRDREREARASPRATAVISAVIPAYNEAGRVDRTLRETDAALAAFGAPYEVVLVDDGSSDGTIGAAQPAARELEHVRLIRLEHNSGKGWALVRGAQVALGDVVMFMDADLEVHPRQLAILYDALERDGADVVIGSKLHPESEVEYPTKRRILSFGYYVLVRTLFNLPVRDTQTGLKLFRRTVLEEIIPRLLVKRFAHDLEALVNAHRLGFRIVEVPVVVTQERPLPRLGWKEVVLVSRDTLAIFYRTYLRRYYSRIGASLGHEVTPGVVGATAAERERLRGSASPVRSVES